jgi:hypothetical protein
LGAAINRANAAVPNKNDAECLKKSIYYNFVHVIKTDFHEEKLSEKRFYYLINGGLIHCPSYWSAIAHF